MNAVRSVVKAFRRLFKSIKLEDSQPDDMDRFFSNSMAEEISAIRKAVDEVMKDSSNKASLRSVFAEDFIGESGKRNLRRIILFGRAQVKAYGDNPQGDALSDMLDLQNCLDQYEWIARELGVDID